MRYCPLMGRNVNRITYDVIGAAIEVHRAMGPGMLEKVYQRCMAKALADRGLQFEEQKLCPVEFKGEVVHDAYRPDFLVEGFVIAELKARDTTTPTDEAITLTYLRTTGFLVALLINFQVPVLKQEIRRYISDRIPPEADLANWKGGLLK